MVDKVLLVFLVVNGLFAATGGLIMAFVFLIKGRIHQTPTTENVASTLLLMQTPLTGALVNAGLIFFTFIFSLPSLIVPTDRAFLKIHSALVATCGVLTLGLGLEIWFSTLKTRTNLGTLWQRQTPSLQTLLQKSFNCCGYLGAPGAPFQVDQTCPTEAVAVRKLGCVGPFSNFANGFLDLIFTAMFGIVALDAILFLCVMMMLKSRTEKDRYRHIDEKIGHNNI